MTGAGAVEWAQQQRASLHAVIDALKVNPIQAVEAIERLQADSKRLTREVSELKTKLATGGGGKKAAYDVIDVGGVSLVRQTLPGIDKDGLRAVADQIRAQIKSGIVVLASPATAKSRSSWPSRRTSRRASRPARSSRNSPRWSAAPAAAGQTSPKPAANSPRRSTRC